VAAFSELCRHLVLPHHWLALAELAENPTFLREIAVDYIKSKQSFRWMSYYPICCGKDGVLMSFMNSSRPQM
jgi:hypothetical protein